MYLPPGEKGESEAETKYRNWLRERYDETWNLMLTSIEEGEKSQDSSQALISCMKLLAAEGKHPINLEEPLHFLRKRLRSIIEKVLSEKRSQLPIMPSFKEFAEYIDIVQNCWSILSALVKKTPFKSETLALNCLNFVNVIPLSKTVQDNSKLFIPLSEKASGTELFEYSNTRKQINRVWNNMMMWVEPDLSEAVHRQMLIVLLECILAHLENPILLTDFLMDSLDCGKKF